MGQKPHRICNKIKGSDGKERWNEIGVAFTGGQGHEPDIQRPDYGHAAGWHHGVPAAGPGTERPGDGPPIGAG